MRVLTVSAVLALVLSLTGPAHASGAAALLRDIAPGAAQGPLSRAPFDLTPFNEKVAFLEDAGIWVSDGTNAGTRPVHLSDCEDELCPEGSAPEIFGTVNRFLVFSAPNMQGLLRLWRSDGTRAGTIPLTTDDPAPVFVSRLDGAEIVLDNKGLYLPDCHSQTGCDLWRSDATPAGTRVAKHFDGFRGLYHLTLSGDFLYFILQDLTAHLWAYNTRTGADIRLADWTQPGLFSPLYASQGNRVYFFAPQQDGPQLWTSDGTTKGTRPLTHFKSQFSVDPSTAWVKAAGSRVYFAADDGSHGTELWRSDGTEPGTQRVSDFQSPDALSGLTPDGIAEAGGKILFQASDGATKTTLWMSDGRPESTAPFRKLCQTADCPLPDVSFRLVQNGGQVFIRADQGAWSTDGTLAGTHPFWDAPCAGDCSRTLFQLLRGRIAFYGHDSVHGFEIWWSDGTRAGTRRLTDVPEGEPTGAALAAAGPWIYFLATGRHGLDLWVTDGRETHLPAVFDETAPSSLQKEPTAVGDRLFFTACDKVNRSIWVSGGTPETTAPVPGTAQRCTTDFSYPSSLAAAGGRLFFLNPDASATQLWSTDGDPAVQLTHFTSGGIPFSFSAVELQGQLLFSAHPAEHDTLWTSDGTPAGTVQAIDLPDLVRITGLQALGGDVFFLNTGAQGTEIWRTDGTTGGTRKLASGVVPFSRFVRAGSSVFFVVGDNALWKTDGTVAGTSAFKTDLEGTIQQLTASQSNLYFVTEAGSGLALWRSDGTDAGTTVIGRFVKRFPGDGDRSMLTVAAGRLFFAVEDGVHGRELWASDGTAGGTRMVSDIVPGRASSSPAGLTSTGAALFFSAFDVTHGRELWTSDGTAAGTHLVQDIAPEAASSRPDALVAAGDHLFFTADDGLSGREPWSLPLSAAAGCHPSSTCLCLNGGRYQVEASWLTAQGQSGAGTAVPLSADTGYFWFFDAGNAEAVVKVLDGQAVNGHVWVFYGALSNVEYTITVTDTRTGLTRRYFNSLDELASVGDTHGFGPLGANGAHPRPELARAAPSPPPLIAERRDKASAVPCQPSPQRLCLSNGRFGVEVAWKDFQRHTGQGTAVPLSGDTGTFWFFDAANVELIVKALDGRPVNGHFWLFYGALSNVEYTVTVTDSQTGTKRTYTNPSGRFASVADTTAF